MTSSQNGDHFHNDFGGGEGPHRVPSDSYDAVDNRFGDPEIPPRIGDEYQVEIPKLSVEASCESNTRKCIVGGGEVPHQTPSDSYNAVDNRFGDPEIPPRIGDEYQVEIPPLSVEANCASNTRECIVGGAEDPHQTPSDSYDAVGNKFGDSEIPPRIGDEYQVEIPRLIVEANYASNTRKCIVAETGHDPGQNFLIGLTIPLTRISNQKRDSNNALKAGKHGPGYFLVPGLFVESWSVADKGSFLLALYIFEKNFVEVKRFVGTKNMGELLSFYYGKFYGSQEYRRWSECRKTKSRKGVYGRRLFWGLRQQVLMSRILPRVSEECRNTLSEVSKTFTDEKMSLAEYVSSLKSLVGSSILVEAVGIGTGKQDLTTMALEPSKSNQAVPTRPEIPTGKACSTLTTSEIIKFLSGDYRLSKARSNDIFWEAVWPRLLARGWHSEQPKNQGYIKNCLVFLMPGIKKFSRRKLVKEVHYFDSVTDVLSKVAKEPGLIELDDDHVGKNEVKKSGVDGNDSPMRQRHCYLQPRRTPKRNTVGMKFTVVDTSLSGGKIRELRSLPSEILNVVNVQDCNEDSSSSSSDEESIEETIGESETVDTAKSDEGMSQVCPDISGVLVREPRNEEGFQEKDHSRKSTLEIQRKDRSRKNKDEGVQETDNSRKNGNDLLEKRQSCKNKDEGLQENDRYRKNTEEGLQVKVHSRKNKGDLQENRPRKNKEENLQGKDHSRKNKDSLQENDRYKKNTEEGLQEKVHSRKNKDDLQENRPRKNKDEDLQENDHSRKNKDSLPENDRSRKNADEGLLEKVHSRMNKDGLHEIDPPRKNKDEAPHEKDHSKKNKDEDLQENAHSRKIKEEFPEKNQLSRKPSKSPISPKLKQGQVDHMGPATKRCKTLTSCNRDEANTNTCFSPTRPLPLLENGLTTCSSGTHEMQVNSSPQVRSTSCSSSAENSHTRTMFDLNLPQIPPESDDGVFLTAAESSREPDSHTIKIQSLPKISTAEVDLNPRRHGTRNRPPTTRALEALANGYLTVNRRRKGKDSNTPDDAASSRPSQRARVAVEPNESTNSSVASHAGQEAENGVPDNGNLPMFVKSGAPQPVNEESVSGK